ncbi:MAG: hypothetical protein IPH33_12465 [Bacteroidetes bacterium]|nr:hypothetical protein [Bacteroidota bacterium]
MTKNDADEIFRLRSDKKITEYLDRDPPKSIEEIYEWLIKLMRDRRESCISGMYLKGRAKTDRKYRSLENSS